MTTNSPNPVDGDVQALICALGILKPEIATCPALTKAVDIAIAALTAEPVGVTDHGEVRGLKSEKNFVAHVMPTDYEGVDNGDEIWLYTAPLVPALKPIELPKPERLDGNGYGYYFDMNDLFEALDAAGAKYKVEK